MRRWYAVALAAVLVVPASGLLAQEAEGEEQERGQLMEIITWHVTPDQDDAWKGAVETLVAAAEAAGVAEHRWGMWSQPTSYTLVYPVGSFAYFDDPEQFARAFQGTPGEEGFGQAMAAFEEMGIATRSVEVVEAVESWSYDPGGDPIEIKHAHLDVIRARPGMEREFGELAEEWVAMLGEVGYAYEQIGHRVRLGEPRFVFVTLVDDLASYYGENALPAAVEAAGAGERFEALLERFEPVILEMKHYDMAYEPSLSYWPPEAVAAN